MEFGYNKRTNLTKNRRRVSKVSSGFYSKIGERK
jgi:hypothetical protein